MKATWQQLRDNGLTNAIPMGEVWFFNQKTMLDGEAVEIRRSFETEEAAEARIDAIVAEAERPKNREYWLVQLNDNPPQPVQVDDIGGTRRVYPCGDSEGWLISGETGARCTFISRIEIPIRKDQEDEQG